MQERGVDEWRAHWRVVAGAGIGIATGYSLFPFVASQFVQPLQAAFGWSRGAQALTQSASLVGALLAPLVGRAVDTVGARRIALLCMPVLACVYGLMASMNGSIGVFYVLMAFAIFIGLGTTGIVFIRPVTTWFDRSLGRALALTRTGIALSGACAPVLLYQIIHRFGWRAGYGLLAVITILGILPSWGWVRESTRAHDRSANAGRSWVVLLRDRKIIRLCVLVALTIGPVVGLLGQLQPLLTGKGLEAGTAAMLGGLLALSVLLGTLLTGVLVDKIWAPLVGCLFAIGPLAGCALLLAPSLTPVAAALAVAGVGLAQGAELDLAGYLIARYFGLADFAAIFGLSICAIGISCALSAMAFARVFDVFGGYEHALQASMVIFIVAGLGFLTLGRYPPAAGN